MAVQLLRRHDEYLRFLILHGILNCLLPKHLKISHISLFDQVIQGIEHKTKPFFSVQYHPESSPGPHDSRYLFEKFRNLIIKNINAKKK